MVQFRMSAQKNHALRCQVDPSKTLVITTKNMGLIPRFCISFFANV